MYTEMDKIIDLKGLFRKKEKYTQLKNKCETHYLETEIRTFLYQY